VVSAPDASGAKSRLIAPIRTGRGTKCAAMLALIRAGSLMPQRLAISTSSVGSVQF
jgi:hypothetical protein